MDFEKQCFVAYCSDDETLRSEFKRLVDLKVQEGKTQHEAVKEIRKAVSAYFSYRAKQEEKDAYSDARRKRCFDAVIKNDVESEQFIASIYGLSCTETVTYARSYAFATGAKKFGPCSNFEVAGRKYVAASKKRQSATPENEDTFIKLARKISYSGFRQIKSFFDRIKVSDEYFSKMVKYLKTNKPEIYKTLITNINTANLMLSCDSEDVAQQLELIETFRDKIVNNPNYTILDFYKESNGLSASRFYALYSLHYTVNNDSNHKIMAKFLKKNDEDDNVYSPSTIVSKAYKDEDGNITYRTFDATQSEIVFNYIKEHGWPCNMFTFSTGLDMILERPEFFEPNGPKKA